MKRLIFIAFFLLPTLGYAEDFLTPKNRLRFLFGYGPGNGTVQTLNGNTYVNYNTNVVVGLAYDYKLNELFNVGLQVQSNSTVLGSVGFDF